MELSRIISGEMYFYFDGAYCGMRQELTFDEDIDGNVLKEALLKTQKVHPYLKWTIEEKDGEFFYKDTDTDTTLIEGNKDIVLGTDEFDGHLIGFLYYGNKLRMDLYHGLTDGVSSKRIMETLLYHYFSIKDGCEYKADNILIKEADEKCGYFDEPYEKEIPPFTPNDTPFAAPPEDEIFRFSEHEEADAKSYVQCIRISDKDFMSFVKENDSSPAAAFAVLISQTIQKMYPDNKKQVKINVPINLRSVLGVDYTFRNTTGDVAIYYDPDKLFKLDIKDQCKAMRTSLKEKMARDNLLSVAKSQVDFLGMSKGYKGYDAKYDMYSSIPLPPSDSIFISYIGKLNADSYDKHITDFSLISGARDGIVFNIYDCGGDFFLTSIKKGSLKGFSDAFCEHLKTYGLDARVMPEKEIKLKYVALRERLSLKGKRLYD